MMKTAGEWFADEAFWTAAYPFMFPQESFTRAGKEVERIIALSGVSAGGALDLGCGPGRHSVPLARRGWRVTGVDRTAFLLSKARAYAAAEGAEVEWVQEDMRDFLRSDAFDLVLSLFTSFGYFEDPAENQKVLKNAFESLREGGRVVIDLLGKEIIARIYQSTSAREVEGAGLWVERRNVVDDWTRMDNQWILVRDDRVTKFRIRHWIYSGAELKELLLEAGFARVQLYGDLEESPYGPEAKRLVAVGLKAGNGGVS